MTRIRAEVSKKNPLYIDKHTFYTVLHFVYQYPEWKRQYVTMIGSATKGVDYNGMPHGNGIGDPTARLAIRTSSIKSKIDMVESAAMTAGGAVLYKYLLFGVTHEGITYNYLKLGRNEELGIIPCGKNQYYQMRRLFYYLVAQKFEDMIIKS